MRHAGGCAQTWLQSFNSCSSSQVNRNVGMYMKMKKHRKHNSKYSKAHIHDLKLLYFLATFCIQVLHLTARGPLPDLKILISIPVPHLLTHGPPGTKHLAMLPPVATHHTHPAMLVMHVVFPTVDCCITLFFKKKCFLHVKWVTHSYHWSLI